MIDWFNTVYTLIQTICDPLWRIGIGIVIAILVMLITSVFTRNVKTVTRIGGVFGIVVWGILSVIAYLLNVPLGDPLPKSLPADYLSLWLGFIVAVFIGWLIIVVIDVIRLHRLTTIESTLVELLHEIRNDRLQ